MKLHHVSGKHSDTKASRRSSMALELNELLSGPLVGSSKISFAIDMQQDLGFIAIPL